MTLYRQYNETDDWKVDEVHITKFSENSFGASAKLKNGRIACMGFKGWFPTENDEQEILNTLYGHDFWEMVKEWIERKRHLFCCGRCE